MDKKYRPEHGAEMDSRTDPDLNADMGKCAECSCETENTEQDEEHMELVPITVPEEEIFAEGASADLDGSIPEEKAEEVTAVSLKPSPSLVLSPEAERPRRELRRIRLKAFLFSLKKVKVGYDCRELLGKDVTAVHMALHNRAFKNIKTVPIRDVYTDSPDSAGKVEQITIAGNSVFDAGNRFRYSAEIVIMFHEKREIMVPFSAKSLKKQNYTEVIGRFQELGFTEIYEAPVEDLITGWIAREGSVKRVSIAENCRFQENSVYPYDERITVEYHRRKKKN